MQTTQLKRLCEGWRTRGKEMRAKYDGQVGLALEALCETHAEEVEELIDKEHETRET